MAILTLVDVILIAQNTGTIKMEISELFNMEDLGTSRQYIGVLILHYEELDHVTINVQGYFCRGLEDTDIAECRAVSTPIDDKNRLLQRSLDEEAAPGQIIQHQKR